jgi:hypothetical protein
MTEATISGAGSVGGGTRSTATGVGATAETASRLRIVTANGDSGVAVGVGDGVDVGVTVGVSVGTDVGVVCGVGDPHAVSTTSNQSSHRRS